MQNIQDLKYLAEMLDEAYGEIIDLQFRAKGLEEELEEQKKRPKDTKLLAYIEKLTARINESISIYENMTSGDRSKEINTLKAVLEIIRETRA